MAVRERLESTRLRKSDFWEPVFHAALANDAVYIPAASGGIIQLDKATGAVLQRIAPFGVNPNTYETGPIAVDSAGNLFYNVVQVAVDPVNGFYANDTTNSWLGARVPPQRFGQHSRILRIDLSGSAERQRPMPYVLRQYTTALATQPQCGSPTPLVAAVSAPH